MKAKIKLEKPFNYSKLKARTAELGKKDREVASAAKMNPGTYSLKLNNKGVFTQDQICNICIFLLIPFCDIPLYFFAQKV